MTHKILNQLDRAFKRSAIATGIFILLILSAPASIADQFSYDAVITDTTSFLGTLVPIGSLVTGSISVNNSPNGTTTNTGDLTSALIRIQNFQGATLFCLPYNQTCGPGETAVPIETIDAINLTFDANGCPVSGTLDITAHSNTFGFDMPVNINLSDGTVFASAINLGTINGTGSIPCAAEAFDYAGEVTETDSFLGTLVPVGSGVIGTMNINGSANGMTTNPHHFASALLKITNTAGTTLFCFPYNDTCAVGETIVSVESIDAINLTFDAYACPIAGSIAITAHSNTFGFDMPVSFDLDAGTFVASADGLGSASGTGVLACGADTDEDGVPDSADNCTLIANANQRDTNSDGYGNACDPDLDNNNIVNFGDVSMWVPFFNSANTGDQDFNGDGNANFGDYALFPAFFQQPPGPSGVAP